ncbi:alcohol dehydrogenase catalytic domain-containing protein [Amycolatopsis sp. lyj-90]|uniref:alcohol dehydrogenase catalytic domain-containing protein n=1 Tax=Amycolatopsis sp. lyj-90 TaxID=2789285 RepID=UPI00397DB4F2
MGERVPPGSGQPSVGKASAVARLPATMRAVRFDSGTGELTLETVPLPELDVDEVLVKVEAGGICDSDVDLIDGRVKPHLRVITPGHEAAGVVAAVGSRVKAWIPGDRVVMAAGRECGMCAECGVGCGWQNCSDLQMMALHYDGAWAEYAVTSATALVAVPSSISLEHATVLSGSVSTPYAAMDTARLRVAEAVGVWGLGGLGTHLIQLARICGASPIVALDERPAARERSLERGADVALDPANSRVCRYIKEITKGQGLDVAFDLLGGMPDFGQAQAALGRRGRLVVVGTTPDVMQRQQRLTLTGNSQTIISHSGYRVRHLQDSVELTHRGRLDVSASITAVLPLEQAQEGVRRMRDHDGDPVRLLLRP